MVLKEELPWLSLSLLQPLIEYLEPWRTPNFKVFDNRAPERPELGHSAIKMRHGDGKSKLYEANL